MTAVTSKSTDKICNYWLISTNFFDIIVQAMSEIQWNKKHRIHSPFKKSCHFVWYGWTVEFVLHTWSVANPLSKLYNLWQGENADRQIDRQTDRDKHYFNP